MASALRFNPEGHGTAGNDEVTFSPTLSFNVRSSSIDWFFEFRIKLDALPGANAYILGGSSTANTGVAIRLNSGVYTCAVIVGGALSVQSSADMFLADGAFHTYRIERNISVSTDVIFKRDGVEFGSRGTLTSGTSTLSCSRFGRGSSTGTYYTALELEYFICSTTTPIYAEWVADLASGTGNTLFTTDGSRDGTLNNFTAVDADKWIMYGAIALECAMQAVAAISASLTTQVQLKASLTAIASLTGALLTSIKLVAGLTNTSAITGELTDSATVLPPQFIPVIVSITPYSSSAAVTYTYSGSDATSYKGRINGGAPFTLSASPAIIVGLSPETTYSLELAAENAAGLGDWSVATDFTTTAVSGNTELIIMNIVQPCLYPLVKEIKK